MKNRWKMMAGIAMVLAVSVTAFAQGRGAGPGRGAGRGPGLGAGFGPCNGACLAAVTSSLTDDEMAGLRAIRDEEKLAHDVYVALGTKWNLPVFTRIADAESQHLAVIERTIKRYVAAADEPASVAVDPTDKFWDEKFATRYEELVEQGSASADAALRVAAGIEELDIRELRTTQEATTHASLQRIYQNLEQASHNHLRAFVRRAERTGNTYEVQHLAQADFDDILAATSTPAPGPGLSASRGRGLGMGPGMGPGMGAGRGPGNGQAGRPGRGPGQGRGMGQGRGPGNGPGRNATASGTCPLCGRSW